VRAGTERGIQRKSTGNGRRDWRRRNPRSLPLQDEVFAKTCSFAAAAAAVATTTAFGFGKVFVGRDTAELEGEGNEFADLALEVFKLTLGVHEIDRHAVVEQSIAGTFEFADFGGAELNPGVLLLVKGFPTLVDGFVLELGGIVREEFFDGFLEFVYALVFGDFSAEFQG